MAGVTAEPRAEVEGAAQSVLRAAAYVVEATAGDPSWRSALPGETEQERDAWFYMEKVAEIGTLVWGAANLISQVALRPGFIDPDDGRTERPLIDPGTGELDPRARDVGITDDLAVAARDALDRCSDRAGSKRSILHAQSQCWDVTGDGWLIGYPVNRSGHIASNGEAPVTEEWRFVAKGALTKNNGANTGYRLHRSPSDHVDLPASTFVRRMMREHPRFPGLGQGWVRRALEPAADIYFFAMAQRAAASSGIPSDVWLVPAEAAPRDSSQFASQGEVIGADGDEDPTFSDMLIANLGEYVTKASEVANVGSKVLPTFIEMESRLVESVRKVSLYREIDSQLPVLLDQSKNRLAEAADSHPEMLRGLGDTNRWNGAQIADDEYRRYFKGKVDAMSDAWTFGVLHHDLRARRFPERMLRLVRVVADPTGVVAPPDQSQVANEGLSRGAIGPSGWRRMQNIPEEYAPSDAELDQMARLRVSPQSHESQGSGRGDTGPPSQSGPEDTDEVEAAAGTIRAAAAVGDLSDQLLRIEMRAFDRTEEAVESAFAEADRRAGNKLKNWARSSGVNQSLSSPIETVPAESVTTVLGPRLSLQVAESKLAPNRVATDLFSDSLRPLGDQFARIVNQAYTQASDTLGATPPPADVEANTEQGTSVLTDTLLAYLAYRLLTSEDDDDDRGRLGEVVAGLAVPALVVRRGLAAAGGTPVGADLRPSREMVEPIAGGDGATARPSLVFGPTLSRLAPPSRGWRWVYGDEPRSQPFPPHVSLDGTVFAGTDDEALAGSPFSEFAGYYAPGDHAGCRCMAAPVYEEGD